MVYLKHCRTVLGVDKLIHVDVDVCLPSCPLKHEAAINSIKKTLGKIPNNQRRSNYPITYKFKPIKTRVYV
jgi:NADH:ubiquinone oxidoreductase subunit B-like Fe-S oxidoreductase